MPSSSLMLLRIWPVAALMSGPRSWHVWSRGGNLSGDEAVAEYLAEFKAAPVKVPEH
jgi:hypothetical protein